MKVILSLIAAAAVTLTSFAQTAGVYTILSGGTNALAYASTNALGSTFAVSDYDNVGIQVSSAASAATVGTLTFRFAESLDSTTYDSTARHVINLTLASATTVAFVTNIAIPSAAVLKLTAIENACTNGYATNITVKWRVKSPKHQNSR